MRKKKAPVSSDIPEMREEYDFGGGVRGKYAGRFAEGHNMVLLDADVASVFPDSGSVNRALRALAGIIRERSRETAS